MIKTTTPTQTQESNTTSHVEQSAAKAEKKAVQENRIRQQMFEGGESLTAESIQEELKDINSKLKAWQDRVDELLNDPNNADKVVNLLNSIQYMINRRAELTILLRQYNPVPDGLTFQDNQSVLRAASVRRKGPEAFEIVDRKPVVVNFQDTIL